MKTRLKPPEKEKAVALTTAQTTAVLARSYKTCVPTSRKNTKDEIGELLFCLLFPVGSELQEIGWHLFERLLRRYIELVTA